MADTTVVEKVDPAKEADDAAKKAAEAAAAKSKKDEKPQPIVKKIGEETLTFENQEAYDKAFAESRAAGKDFEMTKKQRDVLVKALATGDEPSVREAYKLAGASDDWIDKMCKVRYKVKGSDDDEDEEDEDEDTSDDGDEDDDEAEGKRKKPVKKKAVPAGRNGNGKIRLNEMDDTAQQALGAMFKAGKTATKLVARQNRSDIDAALAKNKAVQQFWVHLDEEQRAEIMTDVLQSVNPDMSDVLDDGALRKIVNETAAKLTRTYKDPRRLAPADKQEKDDEEEYGFPDEVLEKASKGEVLTEDEAPEGTGTLAFLRSIQRDLDRSAKK